MAHHKRRRPKSTRSGCLMCKPQKHQACAKHKRLRPNQMAKWLAMKQFICEEA